MMKFTEASHTLQTPSKSTTASGGEIVLSDVARIEPSCAA